MRELWTEIPEFPNYNISNLGRIFNKRFNMYMSVTQTQWGHSKIGLTDPETGIQSHRSVALLVAEAFVEPPNNLCDHVIVLDGDYSNVAASNLALRPRWFAWKYAHQLRERLPVHFLNLPIRNLTTGRTYSCVEEAGMVEGLLFQDVWDSTYKHEPVYPYGHFFEVIKEDQI